MTSEGDEVNEIVVHPTVLGYELDSKQNVVINYLVPSILACSLYVLHFACDFTIAYRHIKEGNQIWGIITLFFMFLPALGCYILTISSWELWPDFDGCTNKNLKWFSFKTLQHIFFPIWSMWRNAEKIFWSIEGVKSTEEEELNNVVNILRSPKTIELYYFLQAYLQAAPQILFQLHILMRYTHVIDKGTIDAQILCIAASIAQIAKVTTFYQRFKSQKSEGKNYPWFKPYKHLDYQVQLRSDCVDSGNSNRRSSVRRSVIVYRCRDSIKKATPKIDDVEYRQKTVEQEQECDRERRRSSDFYEQPVINHQEDDRIEADLQRETSVVGGPERTLYRENEFDEVDFFNPKRLFEKKIMLEDEMGGKTVAFLWWCCFLVARMLSISSFGYFYPRDVIWLMSLHFIMVVLLLLYDVKHSEVRRSKAIFFIFIGWVYLFCLIEFKIKFKKTKFIYNVFFGSVFLENFIMMIVWWYTEAKGLESNWWYSYIFYSILLCSILSLLSMLLYILVLKPKKIVVEITT